MHKRNILILGGARSGKSRQAQKLAAELGEKVLLAATAEARDEEMRQRIDEHRRNRPPHWRVLELPTNVGRGILRGIGDAQVVILDCLTLLVSNVIGQCRANGDWEAVDVKLLRDELNTQLVELFEALDAVGASCIIVSNEVGTGLVPDNRLGRVYRDLLGEANQAVARRADDVYLMVAGVPVQVKP